MYYPLNVVIYTTGVPMAKTAVLVGIISMIMMQSVSGASKINYNQENTVEELAIARAKLKVRGRATGLADRDWGAAGQSDPYMVVTAEDTNGYREERKTPHRGGTNTPRWDDFLVFSGRIWKKITVDIMDYDGGWGNKDDRLCPSKVIYLKSAGNSVTFTCNPGSATVEIVLESVNTLR